MTTFKCEVGTAVFQNFSGGLPVGKQGLTGRSESSVSAGTTICENHHM